MSLTIESATRKDRRTGKSSMQHRHYTTIAAIISAMPDDIRNRVAGTFADELRGTNPNFNRARFLRACA